MIARTLAVVLAILASGAAHADPAPLDAIAERYVKLVLAVGVHDDGYVDAYFGPEDWRAEAGAEAANLAELRARAEALAAEASALPAFDDGMIERRRANLASQLRSVAARVALLQGETLEFDEETAALYGVVAPDRDLASFDDALAQIDALAPGDGPLHARVAAFRSRFVVPPERLDVVFQAAIAECRARTLAQVALPDGERFDLEYVTGKPWGGYNWFQGDAVSLIQINTDLPIQIDRAVDLGCHEGYPGHHAYNALLEADLARARGWVEFTIFPLYSPQALIAEGTAVAGVEMAFPGEDAMAFTRDHLAPLAQLDVRSMRVVHGR